MRNVSVDCTRVTPGSWLHRIAGALEIPVNSLHNQGMDRLAPGLVAEGVAPDGTVEAVRGIAPGFVIGVQWHPEYDWETDRVSRRTHPRIASTSRIMAGGLPSGSNPRITCVATPVAGSSRSLPPFTLRGLGL